MMRLRQPIAAPPDRPLRVLIQARYSTEEQRQTSTEDQIANCRRFLADNLPRDVEIDRLVIEVIREPEVSGELMSRPGINEIWSGIESKRWDLIIAEESSRLYRHMTFAHQLFNTAVDAGIRILCPTDYIDTADEDWPERLNSSQSQHSRANYYNRNRIKRAHQGLWERGAAIGPLRVGYRRRPSKPATASAPAEGPYFDEVDAEQAVIIREVFDRVARDEPPWAVAEWLTSIRFSKGSHAQKPEWSARNVIELIRRLDYRGEQIFRKRISKQQLTTGRSKLVRNRADAVLTRQVPHLRIVSDHLWQEANDAIDRRRTRATGPTGEDHPLSGRPRDSRELLSTIFVCGICGGTMHAEGRNEGGYRCAAARRYACWNRATCVRELTHAAVVGAVVRETIALAECREAIVARVLGLHAAGEDVAAQRRSLDAEEVKLSTAIGNLAAAIEQGGESIAVLLDRLRARERDLAMVRSRREELATKERERLPPPTAAEILAHLQSLEADLVVSSPRAPVILRHLLNGPVRAVPHRQFGSDKVVLRAEFEIVLSRALPGAAAEVIAAGQSTMATDSHPEPSPAAADCVAAVADPQAAVRRIVVDLFQPSGLIRHAAAAHELVETGLPLVQVGAVLGVSKRMAHLCSQLGASMAAAGVTDPFERLTERPAKVSRWHRRRPRGDADRRQAG